MSDGESIDRARLSSAATSRRLPAWRLFVASALLLPACRSTQPPVGIPGPRPNIIAIVVDDLRWDELGITGHPYLETPHIDRLARDGALFRNAFHSVPLCSPNRATILTGQYPSRHGIIDNVSRTQASHRLNTFPRALQETGYETAFLGKWHMGNDPTPRPGFDYWVAIPGQGRSADPELYEEGRIGVVDGYLTDVLTDRAVAFIERERTGPYFLYIGHKAIHPDVQQHDDGSTDPSASLGYIPAPRHRGRYASRELPLRPNAVDSIDELPGKPALARALTRKHASSREQLEVSQKIIRDRAEMLLAVDDSMGRLIATLEKSGAIDDTVILFTSDNGFWYGEHYLTVERRLPYEESIRAPLLVHYPRAIEPGVQIEELVASVDLAPTALDFGRTPIGAHVQGRSLVPLLTDTASDWRDSVLIEFYTYENPFPWLVDMDYRAIRTHRHKYIHWVQHPDENELYDLERDPYELHNLIAEPELTAVKAELQGRLRQAVLEAAGLSDPP